MYMLPRTTFKRWITTRIRQLTLSHTRLLHDTCQELAKHWHDNCTLYPIHFGLSGPGSSAQVGQFPRTPRGAFRLRRTHRVVDDGRAWVVHEESPRFVSGVARWVVLWLVVLVSEIILVAGSEFNTDGELGGLHGLGLSGPGSSVRVGQPPQTPRGAFRLYGHDLDHDRSVLTAKRRLGGCAVSNAHWAAAMFHDSRVNLAL